MGVICVMNCIWCISERSNKTNGFISLCCRCQALNLTQHTMMKT